jgi:hypothetical protein
MVLLYDVLHKLHELITYKTRPHAVEGCGNNLKTNRIRRLHQGGEGDKQKNRQCKLESVYSSDANFVQ